MATLRDIRQAVKDTLTGAIDGLNVYALTRGSVVAPCIVVLPAEADYLRTMRNSQTGWEIDLVVLVPSGDEEIAQNLLDELVNPTGPRSIVAVIHANQGLGRPGDIAGVVQRMSDYGAKHTFGTDDYVGATLRLFVSASNS